LEEKVCTQVKRFAPSFVFGGKSLYTCEKVCTQFLFAMNRLEVMFCLNFARRMYIHVYLHTLHVVRVTRLGEFSSVC
jgi:hypothetical protein